MRFPRLALAVALLGLPLASVAISAAPVSADPLTYTAVSVGMRGACALSTTGDIVCWGDNPERWIMADRPAGAVPTPTRIAPPTGLTWIAVSAADSSTTCAIASNNRAYCWGNHHIGSYFTTTSRTPVEVEFPTGVQISKVQSGYSTACATTTSAQFWCWGDAHYLGDGSIDPVRIPVRINLPDSASVTSFDIGPSGVCVVTSSPNMYCWGNNSDGELGLGYAQQYPYSYSWTPVLIPTPQGELWATPAVGLERICAITVSGAGYCAGRNWQGSFGNDTYDNSMRFTKMIIPDNERLVSMATGWYHTCVGTESGKMWCAGRGDYGELGTGTTLSGRTWRTPLAPSGVTFTSFGAGVAGTCSIDTSGRVWCWGGLNWGSQGTGRVNAGLFPEQIAAVGSPSIDDTGSTSVDAESATITGRVNPNGYVTTVVAEVSTSPLFTNASRYTISASFPNDSFIATTFSRALSNLAPRTTHYVRLIATNTFGVVTGNSTSFITLGEEPTVGNVTSSDLTGNDATINVTMQANRLASTAYFELSTTQDFSVDTRRVDVQSFGGNVPYQRSATFNDLLPRTRYFARAVATNRLGTTIGVTHTFDTVGSQPTVTISSTSATTQRIDIDAHVNSGLARGTVIAEVSTSPTFSSVIQSSSQSFNSRTNQHFSFSLFGLSASTDYWVRVVAENGVGSHITPARLQRTRGAAPQVRVTTTSIDPRRAIASVVVDSTGLTTFTVLQLSSNPDFSDMTEYFISSSASESQQSFTAALDDLTPGTMYYLLARSRNSAGQTDSTTVTFVTPRPLGVIINNDDDDTESTTVSLLVTAPAGAIAYRVSNHANFRNAKVFNPTSPLRWELIASEEAEDIRTVYVQVYLSNGTSVIYSDSITLLTDVDIPDEEAPVIESLRSSRVSATAQAATQKTTSSRVAISVRDRRSGVTRIEVKASGKTIVTKVDAARRGTYNIAIPKGAKVIVVRVWDAAGNYSKWKSVKVR